MSPNYSKSLIWLIPLTGLVTFQLIVAAQTAADQQQANERILIKRQTSATSAQAAAASPNNRMPPISNSNTQANLPAQGQRPPARTVKQTRPVGSVAALADENISSDVDDDESMATNQRAPSANRLNNNNRQRKPFRKQSRRPVDYEEDDEEEDCRDDGEFDLYHSMAARPMLQMQRMMGSMFDTIQGMSSDALMSSQLANGGGRRGMIGSSASSSYSNGDGFSRTSSLVNENGRTRGIVSETRNGRTQTRRIGDRDEDDEED